MVQVLVCSDVAARGLDLPRVSCVLSYDAPQQATNYFHRVGRTARAGKSGTAITLLQAGQVTSMKRVSSSVQELVISEQDLEQHRETVQKALDKLRSKLENSDR